MTARSTRRAIEQEVIDASIAFANAINWPLALAAVAEAERFLQAVTDYTELGLDTSSRPAIGNNTTDTANAAGASMAEHVGAIANECFDEIVATYVQGAVGLTVDALEQRLNRSHQTVSARVNELRDKGWVVDSGVRRATRSGRSAIVWRPTTAALDQRNRR
jgi:hypothetical protein